MLRFAPVAVLALGLAPSVARAETYVAFDIGPAYRTGAYNWKGPPGVHFGDPTAVDIRSQVYGPGAVTHVAIGAKLPSRFALAGEVGFGQFFVDSGMKYSGPSLIALIRVGVRLEKLLSDHAFLRAGLGYEAMAMGGGGVSIGARENVWQSETTSGPWASLGGGLRGQHVGGVARVDVGRATSTHAVWWPITFSVGLDVAWH